MTWLGATCVWLGCVVRSTESDVDVPGDGGCFIGNECAWHVEDEVSSLAYVSIWWRRGLCWWKKLLHVMIPLVLRGLCVGGLLICMDEVTLPHGKCKMPKKEDCRGFKYPTVSLWMLKVGVKSHIHYGDTHGVFKKKVSRLMNKASFSQKLCSSLGVGFWPSRVACQ